MASGLVSKVPWPKPVFLMEILASHSAFKTVVASPPPATSPAPEDDGVKDFAAAAAADPRPERDVLIPASMTGFVSPRGWRVCNGPSRSMYMAFCNAPCRRHFSTGGAPPPRSFDSAAVNDSDAAARAAVEFSDGEDWPIIDYEDDGSASPNYVRPRDFVLRLPCAAVWNSKHYPDSVKVKVAVPEFMGKDIKIDCWWVDDETEWWNDDKDWSWMDYELVIVIKEFKQEEEEDEEEEEEEEGCSTCIPENDLYISCPTCIPEDDLYISFPMDKYDRHGIKTEIKNSVLIFTVPKIVPDEEEEEEEDEEEEEEEEE